MHPRGPLGHRFLDGEDRFEHLVLHLDLVAGLEGLLLRLGDDRGDTVTDVADLLVEELAVVGTRLRVGLPGLHVVDIGAVLMGDDRLHPLDLQRLADVDALDVGVGVGAAQDHQRVVTRLDAILDEGRLTGDQDRTVDLPLRLADVGEVVAERRGDLTLVSAALHPLAGKLDSGIVLLVAAVTDEEATEHLLDLLARRFGMLLKKPGEQERRRRRVVGALHHPAVDHRLLDGIEVPAVSQALGGPYLGAVHLGGQRQVCVDGLVVDEHGVASDEAFTVIAVADAAVSELYEHRAQRPVVRYLDSVSLIVHGECKGAHRAPPLRNSPKS